MRELTVRTVQGIGDIFWVYQKLAPHVERLHLNILCVATDEVQKRAQAFTKLLPKVGRVEYELTSCDEYDRVAALQPHLPAIPGMEWPEDIEGQVLIRGEPLDYAVNGWLEAGVHLEDIDPGVVIERKVALLGVPAEMSQEDYLCVYISGNKNSKAWGSPEWVRLLQLLCEREPFSRVVFIGADYDRAPAYDVRRKLKVPTVSLCGEADIAASLDVMRRSKLFVGYQSGLNILAENYGVRQIMLWFPQLHRMHDTWRARDSLPPHHVEASFSQSPEEVARGYV